MDLSPLVTSSTLTSTALRDLRPVLQYLSVGILDNHLISVALVFCWSFVFKSVEQEDKRRSLNSMISKILFLILNTFLVSFPWDLLNTNAMEPF